jgi:hypothetical protein
VIRALGWVGPNTPILEADSDDNGAVGHIEAKDQEAQQLLQGADVDDILIQGPT